MLVKSLLIIDEIYLFSKCYKGPFCVYFTGKFITYIIITDRRAEELLL